MKVGVLFSGGKDSTYAASLARQRGDEVTCLITLSPTRSDSYMFHYPNIRWTSMQAEAMHLPQITLETKGVKEEELVELKKAVETAKEVYSIEGVYTGALASVYQKSRVERVCDELGVNPGLEGGEGETFVLDCPLFDRRIKVISSKTHWEGDAGYLEILEARL